MRKITKWEIFNRCLTTVQFLVVMIGIGFSVYQVKEITNSLNSKEIEFIRAYSNDLYTNKNLEIDNTISNNLPLLVPEGKFTKEELEGYLGVFNSLSYPFDRNIIGGEFLCDEFSTSLKKAYNNSEVQDYLKLIRQEDSSYFIGFDELAKYCQTSE